MSRARTLRTAAAGGLAGITLLASVAALMALNAGGSVFGLVKIAAGYDRAAEPLLKGPSLLKLQARAEAAALSRSALSQYPYDTSAWLRLAYVDYLSHGALTAEGLANLKRSYDLVAIDSFVGLWRVRFALENSQSLTPDLRASVRNEAVSLWRNGENRAALHDMATTIQNPAGRLSAALWLNRLEAPVTK